MPKKTKKQSKPVTTPKSYLAMLSPQEQADVEEEVRNARPLDDFMFMEMISNEETGRDLFQKIYQTVTGDRHLKIAQVRVQSKLQLFGGSRGIVLDTVGEGQNARGSVTTVNMEAQNSLDGSEFERPMYHLAMILVKRFKKRLKFRLLEPVTIIMLCQHDVFGLGDPVNVFMWTEASGKVRIRKFKIIYVNGAYKDSKTAIGKLIHDLRCSDPDDMKLAYMRDSAKAVKESEEAVQIMSEKIAKIIYEKAGTSKGEIEELRKKTAEVEKENAEYKRMHMNDSKQIDEYKRMHMNDSKQIDEYKRMHMNDSKQIVELANRLELLEQYAKQNNWSLPAFA